MAAVRDGNIVDVDLIGLEFVDELVGVDFQDYLRGRREPRPRSKMAPNPLQNTIYLIKHLICPKMQYFNVVIFPQVGREPFIMSLRIRFVVN